MHNQRGRQSAQLDTFSGTVTMAQAQDLPEGASPRNQNCDFDIGAVKTRQGLKNPFTYSGSSAGPNPGASAVDVNTQGNPWTNVNYVLVDDANYATVTLNELIANVSPTPSMGGGWTNPTNATSLSLYASQTLAIGSFTPPMTATVASMAIPTNATVTGIKAAFQSYSTNASNNQIQFNLQIGAITSPTEQVSITSTPTAYSVGSSTDQWSFALTPAVLNAGFAFSIQGAGRVGTVYLNSLVITVYYDVPTTVSDAIDVTQFGFSVPGTSTPQGFAIVVKGFSSTAATVYAQMVKNGVPVGTAESKALPSVAGSVNLGGINDLFGATWISSDLNNLNFGVRIWAETSQASSSVSIGYVSLQAYFTPSQVNFDYCTTFEDAFGNIKNMYLDASGEWWLENVTSNAGVLSPLFNNTPANSFAMSFTADSRQFVAVSDLNQGNSQPFSYNGTWQDRVSQVGPGASPSFSGTLATGNNAPITAYSASGGVLTLTAVNNFTAGEVVIFRAALADALYPLNGLSFNVLGTGLSGTQFQISTSLVVGSGSSTATATGQYTYPVVAAPNGITQYPFWNSAQGYQSQLDDILWSAGPGSTSSGNVITVYYLQTSLGAADKNLVAAMQAQKFPVYVYVSGTSQPRANGTFLVTSIGQGVPPGGSAARWYFTFNIAEAGYQNLGGGANAQPGKYQLTIATVQTTLPLPGISAGNDITISGDAVTSWNQTWPIINALNSGAYSISQTSMTSGTATYNWALSGATTSPPIVGELVTVTGCLNGNGIFNVTDAVIATVTGSSSGTFTITGFGSQSFSTQVETGQATTSGTLFQIDPGSLTIGNAADNPIYGNSGGGYVTLVGSTSNVIGTGTRKGTVFFITRNGYWTAPAPPAEFTITANTNYILVANIPIGPPNVIARGIAFTEAGQAGVAGANFYTIPAPVSYTFNGVTYLSSSLIVNDNVTTTAQFTFPDSVLLSAEEIDIQGNNLFALGELGDSGWTCQYAGRSVWGRVRNKIQNFLNLSFDGGYNPNPGGTLMPLGWGLDQSTTPSGTTVTLNVSPVFGDSFYVSNGTGIAQSALGRITQSAYQDYNGVAILQPNTTYSVRVTCRTPSSATIGALVVDLTDFNSGSGYGKTYGTYTLNCSAMTSSMATYEGTLLTTGFQSVPVGLLLRLWMQNLANGGDIEVDRVDIYPTEAPTNMTALTISYKNDWESFDQTTGGQDTSTMNAQPTTGGFVIHDQLYILKESSLGYLSDTPNQEPANWNPFREVSNVAGASGINAWDVGEEWAIMGCQNGLFGFNGGAPVPIQLEIPDIWQAINWKTGGQSVVIRNDVTNRRIFIAAPMTTPNQWCPDFPATTNPTTPNVIIYLNYKGIGSIEQLLEASSLHVTMLGRLAVNDLRRKWSLWSVKSPYMAVCKRSELYSEMLFCNGIGSSKIYQLGSYQDGADDGTAFTSSYCTFGFVDPEKAKELPIFGQFNKRYVYWDLLAYGSGTASLTFYQNMLTAPYPFVAPGGVTLTNPAANDLEGNLDEFAQRLFVEIKTTGVGNYFNVSRLTLTGNADAWSPWRGK